MVNLSEHVSLIVVFIGAFLGSVKASVEFDKDKKFFARMVDVFLGVFCGMAIAYHFQNQGSVALSGLLALVGGAGGAMVLEVIMQMIPGITKRFVKNWVDTKIGR